MPEFVKVARLSEILPGKCFKADVNGAKIVLFNVAGQIFAMEDSCSHLGAPLSSGYLGKDSISCEWHGATFDLRTGKALSAPAKDPVPTYPVRIKDDEVEIAL
ncbi:MAG: non-heme iron oxygenase ferredoxin subunit [Candidatus Obscuribacterales bacterium]|nr:non-heme iron oxygenase ferredoxin subunit [Candidatus Obscuribacterales bacterium]